MAQRGGPDWVPGRDGVFEGGDTVVADNVPYGGEKSDFDLSGKTQDSDGTVGAVWFGEVFGSGDSW